MTIKISRVTLTLAAISATLSLNACKEFAEDACQNPQPKECLQELFFEACAASGADLDELKVRCEKVVTQSCETREERALVPELDGAKHSIRERSNVCTTDQPRLKVSQVANSTSFLDNMAQEKVGYVNEKLPTPKVTTAPPLTFDRPIRPLANDNISENIKDPAHRMEHTAPWEKYSDLIFDPEKAKWNSNGAFIESCREYVYEKYYDFSLLRDMILRKSGATLIDATELAFKGAEPADYSRIVIPELVPNGAVGTLILDNILSSPSTGDITRRKGLSSHFEGSVFDEYGINYTTFNVAQKIFPTFSEDVDYMLYQAHELTGFDPKTMYQTIKQRPKNLFLEVLGYAEKNTGGSVTNGITVSDPEITSVYNQSGFKNASTDIYHEDWGFHYWMFKAAQRQYPVRNVLLEKFHEASLLRRHLLELLSDRAAWESKLTTIISKSTTRSATILKSLKSISPTEKENALRAMKDKVSASAGSGTRFTHEVSFKLKEIDAQIEGVLREAKTMGCLAVDSESYVIDVIPYGYGWQEASGRIDSPNWQYNKVVCDWSPEIFTDKVLELFPTEVFEREFATCMRMTKNDFSKMKNYVFAFPAACENDPQFALWHPNKPQDYTVDTREFRFFDQLVRDYPSAIMACDQLIQQETLKDLQHAKLNYFDPVSKQVMMSRSKSSYNEYGNSYVGIDFGYSFGWSYEGYNNIGGPSATGAPSAFSVDRNKVCNQTNGFAFGNYFINGTFLSKNFNLYSAGSYASNRTISGPPGIPGIAGDPVHDKVSADIAGHGSSFIFIKNERISASPEETAGSYCGSSSYCLSKNLSAQAISIGAGPIEIPVCSFISVTVAGSLNGSIGANTEVSQDISNTFNEYGTCKNMKYAFTPKINVDGFAQVSVSAGVSGVASLSAGVDIGVKFIDLNVPFKSGLYVSQNNGSTSDHMFDYDVWVSSWSNLDYNLNLLAGYFGVFAKVEYPTSSKTWRSTLFSWDGIQLGGNVDSVATQEHPFHAPVKALFGLTEMIKQ